MPELYTETGRKTPIVEHVDVVVAGGGPAGVAAALAAARQGASVRLIETHGQLGGIWTTGLLSWVLDWGNKRGIMQEIKQSLEACGGGKDRGGLAYEPERMKLVLEQACVKAGVKVRLLTRVCAAARDETNRLAVCITESKSGREAFAAKTFIDCTGDGDLAAQAGCGFDFGRPAEGPGSAGADRAGQTQPFTLMCLITGVDAEAIADCVDSGDRPWIESKQALLAEFERAGVKPSYGHPTVFPLAPGLLAWMINHQYGGSALSAQELSDHTLEARAEIHRNIDALRALGGAWSGIRVVETAGQIGVREGRRVHGRYTVTVDDLLRGARFDDAVCRASFCIDVHATAGHKGGNTGIEPVEGKTKPYDIPYRALLARDVDGLLLAGRCISGDFLAHASYRVTGNSVALGEAAGVAAAVAARRGVLPHELDFAADLKPLIPPVE